jgi:hypothetical protein
MSNIIKRYSLETLKNVDATQPKPRTSAHGNAVKKPSILEQIQSMEKTSFQKSPPKTTTNQFSPKPRRKPRRTVYEEREIIQKIINELFTRKKEEEIIEAKAQGLLSTEKEKQRKERIVKSRESAKKYLARNKDKAIQIKSKVSRKSKSPKKN